MSQAAQHFLDQRSFMRINAQAAQSMDTAKRAIMVLGYTFAPWLRAPGVKQFVSAAIGALVGRHAQKKMAFALQAESERVTSGTVWAQTTPRESVVVGGILPVGSRIDTESVTQHLRIGSIKIPVPIFFRVQLPDPPWRYRTKAQVMAQFDRPKAATLDSISPCGTRYVNTAPGVWSKRAIPCA